MSRRRRGFLLITALLLSLLLFILTMAYLYSAQRSNSEASSTAGHEQAAALAQCGLSDALAKLRVDSSFPPHADERDGPYSYTETVSWNGLTQGGYRVTVDSSWNTDPWNVLIIQSQGYPGERLLEGRTQCSLRAVIDMQPRDRSNPANLNARCGEIIEFQSDAALY